MVDIPPRPRRFRFSLRTLLIATAVVCALSAWVGYHLTWIRDRQAVIDRPDVKNSPYRFSVEPPPGAPWRLRMFGAQGYRFVDLMIPDHGRMEDYVIDVPVEDPRLTDDERREVERIVRLFPEAFAGAWIVREASGAIQHSHQ